MSRRLIAVRSLTLAAVVGLFSLISFATAQPTPPADKVENPAEALKRDQEENLKLFKRLGEKLLELAQRWEKSDVPADRDRAKTIRAALKLAEERGVENLYEELVKGLGQGKSNEFGKLIGTDTQLVAALREILRTLQTEDEATRLKNEIESLKALIKELQGIKRDQENLMARTDNKRTDADKLAKEQNGIADRTQKAADKLNKKDGDKKEPNKDANAGKKPDSKSEPKGEGKPGEASAEPKADTPSSKEGKGDSKPSEPKAGEGKGMGEPSDSPPGSKSPPSPSGSPPSPSSGSPSDSQPAQPKDEAKQAIEDAVPPQKGAEGDLKKNEREKAVKQEDKAIEKLAEALKQLEKRLAQLREKEKKKLLENLEERVNRMLTMQRDVYDSTRNINTGIRKNNNQRTTADVQKAQTASDREGDIVAEAEKALKLLEGEGTAVVFAAVLTEVKKDMESVQKRLVAVMVGDDTQLIEQQIIDQLLQMLEALKKAKKDLENNPPSNSPPPPGGPPPPQSLIQLIEELKLIRSLQLQVNTRTTAYDKQYPGKQVKDPLIQAELKQLSDRQKVLEDMIHKIDTQMNQ